MDLRLTQYLLIVRGKKIPLYPAGYPENASQFNHVPIRLHEKKTAAIYLRELMEDSF